IDVEHFGDAAEVPTRVPLTPDGLSQGQCRLEGRGCQEGEEEASHGPAIVVKNNREPRLSSVATLVLDEEVKLRMIGLPHRVRPLSFPAMEKVESLRVDSRALMSEGEKPRREPTHQCVDLGVARW